MAEKRATHETLQKQFFQTVILRPLVQTSKTLSFGKGGDKIWLFGAETEYTTFLVVSSVFPKTENTDLRPKKGGH